MRTNTSTRRTGKASWRARFLAQIAAGASVTEATRTAGIARQYVYRVIKHDTEFGAAYEDALAIGTDRLETEARRRAVDGVERPVLHMGKPVFVYVDRKGKVLPPSRQRNGRLVPLVKKEYSDGLLIRLLAARLPARFGQT